MAGYHLDRQVLVDSARALNQAVASLQIGIHALHGVDRVDLGTSGLDVAAADLLSQSATALDSAVTTVTATEDGVRRCLADYIDAEDQITDTLRNTRAKDTG